MSKVIKQMEMDALKRDFEGVRDVVVLSIKGLTCLGIRRSCANLRKKNIRVKVVKNSLTRGVRRDRPERRRRVAVLGGADHAGLGRRQRRGAEPGGGRRTENAEDRCVVQGQGQGQGRDRRRAGSALRDGPQDADPRQAIGAVLSALLSPAASILGGLVGAGGQVAGQIQKISEKTEGRR